MKLLVTGGCGFIGSNFIHYWLEKHPDDNIINFDVLSYAGNPNNHKHLADNSHYSFIKGDVTSLEHLKGLPKDVDYAIHFAAESHVTRSENTPEKFFHNNVEGTKQVLEWAKGQDLKRLIHISTDEVYGSIANGYFKETDKEKGDHQASSAYAKSKSQADDLAQGYFDKLAMNIVRPTNNFGPYQYPEKALPRWVTSALLDQPLNVWGTGKQVRDWLFAKDTASALEAILFKGKPGEIYNIGANHQPEHNNLEIAQKTLKVLGKPTSLIKMIPDPRPDHDFRYGVDTTKLKGLGWRPGEFESQFALTVNWYKDNDWWWKPIKDEAERLYQGKEKV